MALLDRCIQHHLCSDYEGLWGLVVVELSCRPMAAQAMTLGLIPSDRFALYHQMSIYTKQCVPAGV